MTDSEYLIKHAPQEFHIDDDIQYAFSERVSIRVIDGRQDLDVARRQTLLRLKDLKDGCKIFDK